MEDAPALPHPDVSGAGDPFGQDAIVFEHDMSDIVNAEYGLTLLTSGSEPQQKLVFYVASSKSTAHTFVNIRPWLKTDFRFTNVVFGTCLNKIYPDRLKPPDVTSISLSVCERKNIYPRDNVISAGHDHQTPPIFVTSRKDIGCFSFLFSCIDRTQHDPPHSSNDVS